MHFLLTLISELKSDWAGSVSTTAYYVFVKIPTISYYVSLNRRHCSFCSYTILLPQYIFQKNAFGITNILSLSSSQLVLVAECFNLSRDDSHIAWVNLMHCKATEHIQGTQNPWHLKHLINLLRVPNFRTWPSKSLCTADSCKDYPHAKFWILLKNQSIRTQ